MKKLFIIFIGVLIFINCAKNDEIYTSLNEAEKEKVTEETVMVDDFIYIEKKVKYHNDTYNIDFTVYYDIFKNENHPNGYILITKIVRNYYNYKDIFNINKAKYPDEYISYIHIKDQFNGSYIYNDDETINMVTLEDKFFRECFRTAESMIIASFKSGDDVITTQMIIDANNRMKDREFGISLNE